MTETIIAAKTLWKRQLSAHVWAGGGVVKITEAFGIKFVALNENYVQVQIVCSSDSEPIKSSSWTKSVGAPKKKTIKESRIKLQSKIETEELL